MQWEHFRPNEATWEMVDQIWAMYSSLFISGGKEIFGICTYLSMVAIVNTKMSCVIKL